MSTSQWCLYLVTTKGGGIVVNAEEPTIPPPITVPGEPATNGCVLYFANAIGLEP